MTTMKPHIEVFIAVLTICMSAWIIQASTPILCNEPNTEYFECKSNCTDKCPSFPPRPCPKICNNGCFCKQGHSRADNGECIPTGTCPVNCPENTHFDNCICTDACDKESVQCFTCNYLCACNEDFRRINGTCQSKDLCPVKTSD